MMVAQASFSWYSLATVFLWSLSTSNAFVVVTTSFSSSSARHYNGQSPLSQLVVLQGTARGMGGMGMGSSTSTSTSTSTSSSNKKKKNGTPKAGNGMGNSNNAKKGNNNANNNNKTPFDANASLQRLEKKYDQLLQASHKAIHGHEEDDNFDDCHIASELVVTVRSSASKSAATSDWVPVAQLCLVPHTEVASPLCQAAVSLYCRELAQAATLGAKIFATVPRQDLQYAIEPVESFYKHVYDPIHKQVSTKHHDNEHDAVMATMTKQQARDILELVPNDNNNGKKKNGAVILDDPSQIKQAYRQKAFQWHPDRLSSELSPHQQEEAAQHYAKIQKAYETLSSANRSLGASWYASLGGRQRTDFVTIQLLSRDDALAVMDQDKSQVQAAIVPLDPSVTQTFVARNQAAGAVMSSSSISSSSSSSSSAN